MPTCPVECPAYLRVPWPGDGSGSPKAKKSPGYGPSLVYPGVSKPGFASRVWTPPVRVRVTTRVRYMADPGFFPGCVVYCWGLKPARRPAAAPVLSCRWPAGLARTSQPARLVSRACASWCERKNANSRTCAHGAHTRPTKRQMQPTPKATARHKSGAPVAMKFHCQMSAGWWPGAR